LRLNYDDLKLVYTTHSGNIVSFRIRSYARLIPTPGVGLGEALVAGRVVLHLVQSVDLRAIRVPKSSDAKRISSGWKGSSCFIVTLDNPHSACNIAGAVSEETWTSFKVVVTGVDSDWEKAVLKGLSGGNVAQPDEAIAEPYGSHGT